MRKPFEGVGNIVRFNWHFFVVAALAVASGITVYVKSDGVVSWLALYATVVIAVLVLIPLLVSYYVYDASGLYELKWLDDMTDGGAIINLNAGLDEFTVPIRARYPKTEVSVFDFYDPLKHTEVSIKRARKRYPPIAGTEYIITSYLPLRDECVDDALLIFTAHEIRDNQERVLFFKELSRTMKSDGRIIIVEHLRDTANFLAYNLGAFHFLPKEQWYDTFDRADLSIVKEQKINPFVTKFILEKNGNTP